MRIQREAQEYVDDLAGPDDSRQLRLNLSGAPDLADGVEDDEPHDAFDPDAAIEKRLRLAQEDVGGREFQLAARQHHAHRRRITTQCQDHTVGPRLLGRRVGFIDGRRDRVAPPAGDMVVRAALPSGLALQCILLLEAPAP